jgi:hypothetical protein
MWGSRRDFQEEWEGWEAGFWLSMLSTRSSFPPRIPAFTDQQVARTSQRRGSLMMGLFQFSD